jgi:hypothetical protein
MYCTEQLRKYFISTNQSQIDVLNKDFNAANSDFNQVPTLFAGVKANVGISFVLEAVYRKATTKTSWYKRCNENCFSEWYCSTSPTKNDLWACTIGGGILGYAQFPGGPLLLMVL